MLFSLFSFSICTVAETSERVFDQANLLSTDEKNSLEQAINEFKEKNHQDFVFVSTENTDGKTPEAYADDFYDNNDFGLGDDKSGMLFLIDMEHRKFHISTTGNMIDILNDNRIDQIINSSTEDMKDDRFYDAIKYALTASENYIKDGPAANTHRVARDNSKAFSILTIIIASIAGIGSTIGFYVYISRNYLLKKATYHYPYYEMSSLDLTESHTSKIFDITTTRHIPKPPPSNGSSTHTGSSGTSHGGGGGSF
ncbi:TPM domain-containing protein [Vagococcus sp. CY53-2]|uniref:TPM domain-containing protein n=1 Tax=Vagococcus sp. CY53-2 TaxID=2925780 RepID=UPI001F511C63|nr:TPM domain-containing protein [Vagococcus sp. CY53-2]MCI0130079.1 TPM domain-containing protein [Vagococcus sp. CY53-2]